MLRGFTIWLRKPVTILSILLAAAIAFIVALLLRDVDLSPPMRFAREYAPVAAVVIALASLMTATFATWMNWQAARRQATLEAWTKWSDSTVDDRKTISNLLGLKSLSPDQAEALLRGTPKPKPARRAWVPFRKTEPVANPARFTDDERTQLVHAATNVLNGLERLAVGVEIGVYRRAVLVDVGGTIIKRTFERFEPYIQLRRNNPVKSRRQEKAYVSLEKLAQQIRHNEVDAERLASLRRQP